MQFQYPDNFVSKLAARSSMALRREDGNATVEAVIWMPILFAAFGFIADTSMIFGAESQTLRIVQDANRAFSIGRLKTSIEVEDLIESQTAGFSPNAQATSTIVNGLISTSVELPLNEITSTGLVTVFLNKSVTVFAQHLSED